MGQQDAGADGLVSGPGRPVPRREALLRGFVAGGGLLAATWVPGTGVASGRRPARVASGQSLPGPRIVIAGAGLAGLRCAHVLWTRHGIRSAVYEGSNRIGGRCWSLRGFFSEGFVSEHGGQFISIGHRRMMALVAELGLGLEIVDGSNLPHPGRDVYWMGGAYYSYREANEDWHAAWPTFHRALRAWPTAMPGRSTRGTAGRTRTGVPASTPPSQATKGCPKATSISAASTPPTTSRASWREQSSRESASPGN